ncbi:uncharacterized protein [Nicotiana sylvestris]|uniref:uncharacterized protein n=1 Tax=Nicotiana sylvestris TaxID=4096 RepID=UPI00388C9CD1
MPKFDLYDRHRDHVAHLRGFCSKIRGAGRKDELLIAYFSQSLSGAALEWYTHQDHSRWYTWDDLAQAFARHFLYNIEIVPDHLSLTKIEKKPSESFREYGFRWREPATRVNPPMEEDKMVEYFIQALEPTYFGHLISAIEKCWHLKNAIQELIDTNQIVVQSPEAPNINQNPLPAHAETHMIEIVHKNGEPKKTSQSVMMIRSCESKPVKDPVVTKATSSIAEGLVDKLSMPNNKLAVVVEKRSPSDVVAKKEKPKVIVPEVSRRCFAPEELRKAKTLRDNPVLVKKSVTEEEAEEFLRKMKILNEAHVPDKITVNHLEKMSNKIFEANGITFSANILPLSTLNKLKVDDERIHKNSICVRGFDRGGKDSIGNIMLELTIGPVEFTMEFQVLDVVISYNLLLGGPWIHVGKAVLSSLHQMVKFEWDRQEIVVHGDKNLCAFNDTSVPFIEAEKDKGLWVYQVSKIVSVEKVPEREYILGPKLASATVMVATEMLKKGFVQGKGLGASLQGIVQLVSLRENMGTFGLGFKPIGDDVKKARKLKKKAWSLPKLVPHLSRSFIKAGVVKRPVTTIPKPVVDFDKELVKRFHSLFDEVNMVETGEGSSKVDVQFIGSKVKLNNWDDTPLPTWKEFCINDMTCMRTLRPSLKSQSNSEIIIQQIECDDEIEYDEEEAFKEISKELSHFEEKPKPNLNETEAINLGDPDNIRETWNDKSGRK